MRGFGGPNNAIRWARLDRSWGGFIQLECGVVQIRVGFVQTWTYIRITSIGCVLDPIGLPSPQARRHPSSRGVAGEHGRHLLRAGLRLEDPRHIAQPVDRDADRGRLWPQHAQDAMCVVAKESFREHARPYVAVPGTCVLPRSGGRNITRQAVFLGSGSGFDQLGGDQVWALLDEIVGLGSGDVRLGLTSKGSISPDSGPIRPDLGSVRQNWHGSAQKVGRVRPRVRPGSTNMGLKMTAARSGQHVPRIDRVWIELGLGSANFEFGSTDSGAGSTESGAPSFEHKCELDQRRGRLIGWEGLRHNTLCIRPS